VDRLHPARLGAESLEVAVVIDVLRATSTATVLIGRGAPALRVVSSPTHLAELEPADYLIFSELPESGPGRVDNSPVVAEARALDGKTPVLVTTNGTRALTAAAARAETVLLASFLNLGAVVRHLRARAPGRVTLLPAGHFSTATDRTEDSLCAEAIAELLAGRSPDLTALTARSRTDERVVRRMASEATFAADVELALSVDRYPVVSRFAQSGVHSGWIRPCDG
jgi:phosphosulfolactate phosphohydrolase-like enzyme